MEKIKYAGVSVYLMTLTEVGILGKRWRTKMCPRCRQWYGWKGINHTYEPPCPRCTRVVKVDDYRWINKAIEQRKLVKE